MISFFQFFPSYSSFLENWQTNERFIDKWSDKGKQSVVSPELHSALYLINKHQHDDDRVATGCRDGADCWFQWDVTESPTTMRFGLEHKNLVFIKNMFP